MDDQQLDQLAIDQENAAYKAQHIGHEVAHQEMAILFLVILCASQIGIMGITSNILSFYLNKQNNKSSMEKIS